MADEARKAGFSAYSSWYGQYETGGVRQAFDSGFDAGVAEGIRQARKVAADSATYPMGTDPVFVSGMEYAVSLIDTLRDTDRG